MIIHIQNNSVASIHALLSKCWTIQTLIWELWGVSVNYSIKSLLSDIYLQKQSHNNGLSKQGVPNNRCQQDKQTLHLAPLSPHMAWMISCKDLSCTQTLVNCSNNMCQSHTCLYYAKATKVRPLTLWTPSHLDFYEQFKGHVDKHVHNQG